jgi:hypothetical protein
LVTIATGVGFKKIPTRFECGSDEHPNPLRIEAMMSPKEHIIVTIDFNGDDHPTSSVELYV